MSALDARVKPVTKLKAQRFALGVSTQLIIFLSDTDMPLTKFDFPPNSLLHQKFPAGAK